MNFLLPAKGTFPVSNIQTMANNAMYSMGTNPTLPYNYKIDEIVTGFKRSIPEATVADRRYLQLFKDDHAAAMRQFINGEIDHQTYKNKCETIQQSLASQMAWRFPKSKRYVLDNPLSYGLTHMENTLNLRDDVRTYAKGMFASAEQMATNPNPALSAAAPRMQAWASLLISRLGVYILLAVAGYLLASELYSSKIPRTHSLDVV